MTSAQQAAADAKANGPTLDKIKPKDVVRARMAGRKGAWVGCLTQHDEKTLTFKVKWIAEPQMVDREDVTLLEVKGKDGRYVEVTM